MRIPIVVAALVVALASTGTATAQIRMILVAKSGTKCMTAAGGHLVGAACTGDATQTVTPNFAVGGLQIGMNCLRRSGSVLTLAPCRAGDEAEALEVSAATNEIASRAGGRACVDLTGAPGIWRANQPVAFAPCNGASSERWLAGALAQAPPAGGTARPNDAVGETWSGVYVDLHNGNYLVIR